MALPAQCLQVSHSGLCSIEAHACAAFHRVVFVPLGFDAVELQILRGVATCATVAECGEQALPFLGCPSPLSHAHNLGSLLQQGQATARAANPSCVFRLGLKPVLAPLPIEWMLVPRPACELVCFGPNCLRNRCNYVRNLWRALRLSANSFHAASVHVQ